MTDKNRAFPAPAQSRRQLPFAYARSGGIQVFRPLDLLPSAWGSGPIWTGSEWRAPGTRGKIFHPDRIREPKPEFNARDLGLEALHTVNFRRIGPGSDPEKRSIAEQMTMLADLQRRDWSAHIALRRAENSCGVAGLIATLPS